jgi:hypothetical protein
VGIINLYHLEAVKTPIATFVYSLSQTSQMSPGVIMHARTALHDGLT